jgi:hypothetical protein
MVTFGPPNGAACMVCGTDLWDVERYVDAVAVVICEPCVDRLRDALDTGQPTGAIELRMPPRVHGDAPDEGAVGAVADAFVQTFGCEYHDLDDYMEDASTLGPQLAGRAQSFGPGARFTARVDRMRFTSPRRAEVRFQICMNGRPVVTLGGAAVRGADDNWRVTRGTVMGVMPGGARIQASPLGGPGQM